MPKIRQLLLLSPRLHLYRTPSSPSTPSTPSTYTLSDTLSPSEHSQQILTHLTPSSTYNPLLLDSGLIEDGIKIREGDVCTEKSDLIAYIDGCYSFMGCGGEVGCVDGSRILVVDRGEDFRLVVEFEGGGGGGERGLERLFDGCERERKVLEEWVNEGKASEVGMARKKVRKLNEELSTLSCSRLSSSSRGRSSSSSFTQSDPKTDRETQDDDRIKVIEEEELVEAKENLRQLIDDSPIRSIRLSLHAYLSTFISSYNSISSGLHSVISSPPITLTPSEIFNYESVFEKGGVWINGYLGVWKGGDKGDFERFKGIFEGKEGEGFWENYNHGKQEDTIVIKPDRKSVYAPKVVLKDVTYTAVMYRKSVPGMYVDVMVLLEGEVEGKVLNGVRGRLGGVEVGGRRGGGGGVMGVTVVYVNNKDWSLTVVGGGDGPVFLTKERVQKALANLESSPSDDGVYEFCQREAETGGWIVARRGGGRDAVGFFDKNVFKNIIEVNEAWERVLETVLGGVVI
ncbi:hypothetical protein TrVE_jg8080 [Triparma verrucosa]|uniref:Uncharacterized protein n=1 Tax=Triparma verrucosa TaxID=1606542 RepID=A0A9W7FBI6_9STRA|nr:hypothetical protein TrVE_jg8080 [Triparma verrucosa]